MALGPVPEPVDFEASAPIALLPLGPALPGSLGLALRSAAADAFGGTALLPVAEDLSGSVLAMGEPVSVLEPVVAPELAEDEEPTGGTAPFDAPLPDAPLA